MLTAGTITYPVRAAKLQRFLYASCLCAGWHVSDERSGAPKHVVFAVFVRVIMEVLLSWLSVMHRRLETVKLQP